MMRPFAQPYFLQHGSCALFALFFIGTGIDERQGYILPGSKAWQQVELLEHKTYLYIAHIGQLIIQHIAHIFAVKYILSACGRVEASQNVH